MPWKETTPMSLRHEFVTLAKGQDISLAELARRFGISRKTAYKWLSRDAASESLGDRSRRPHASPTRTPTSCEQAVVSLRRQHPQWGGRKLHRVLLNCGQTSVPAPSTITHILRRHGLMPDKPASAQGAWKRFEHASPNDLWQMDFKGTLAIGEGRCDPLTVLDDHSRYNVLLRATPDMRSVTVQAALTDASGPMTRTTASTRCTSPTTGWPASTCARPAKVLPMSWHVCYPCLRSVQLAREKVTKERGTPLGAFRP